MNHKLLNTAIEEKDREIFDLLKELNFTNSDVIVFLSILKSKGEFKMSRITEKTGMHRSNIYESLAKLENMKLLVCPMRYPGIKRIYKVSSIKVVKNVFQDRISKINNVTSKLEDYYEKIDKNEIGHEFNYVELEVIFDAIKNVTPVNSAILIKKIKKEIKKKQIC